MEIEGEAYLCIREVDRMEPFLMNVVSDGDFWLFVGSNTGFTAGRRDPDHALFPYQTVDKILNAPKAGGVLTLIEADGEMWEPWGPSTPQEEITRNLYKHATGTRVIFEETHHRLGLRLTWTLGAGDKLGLIRTCRLENLADSRRSVRVLDGWHLLLPPGVSQETYARFSYLASGYMRHELQDDGRLAIYTLNSGISDRAEPCESLRASAAWSAGWHAPLVLLSDRQVPAFRRGEPMVAEREVRGEFGAHLVVDEVALPALGSNEWLHAADTGLDHAALVRLQKLLSQPGRLRSEVMNDLDQTARSLTRRIAGAGALQFTADRTATVHHYANVLFNCMRGGALQDGYHFRRDDLDGFLRSRNSVVCDRNAEWISLVPESCVLGELDARAAGRQDPQLSRLVREYLPLSFSRRHGDPSRPWNRFEIHTTDSAGKPVFGYSGNWRDIFQNWESLAYSYPACFAPMITVFLNASTGDGYNPYRINREGIDWEVHDPKDPWSHIGYWGDHQIIYLLRLLEGSERFWPGQLSGRFEERIHACAVVPYEILGFDDLVRDPRRSIRFDEALHESLLARAAVLGGDGRLLADASGEVALVTLAEKLLVPLLVKLSNLVPGGGIWLNTQRPEWNDANNALAGWGLSVVTVCYLRRYIAFFDGLLANSPHGTLSLSLPVERLLRELGEILPAASERIDNAARWTLMERLGRAGERHRREVYRRAPLEFTPVPVGGIRSVLASALGAVDATLDANRRSDGLFHSYNLLELAPEAAAVRHLDLMLEGQVAALSSGRLDPHVALVLLKGLRESSLFRDDQHSYLLYPDRACESFLKRNLLPAGWADRVPGLARLSFDGDRRVVVIDADGGARFQADFTNARDLSRRLDALAAESLPWADAVAAGRGAILQLWEEVFHHRSFTGRSGAMFAFEGLGSIYWHMIAKLLLAVQELQVAAVGAGSAMAPALSGVYLDIRSGLGFTKDARTYGAFPTDPYSHTPRHRGAQQPGMTGQVKEEILTRMGELGVHVAEGVIRFEPGLLSKSEFLAGCGEFEYIGVDGASHTWPLGQGSLAFTLFQVPVCYVLGDEPSITVQRLPGGSGTIAGSVLPAEDSRELFLRTDRIKRLTVTIPRDRVLASSIP